MEYSMRTVALLLALSLAGVSQAQAQERMEVVVGLGAGVAIAELDVSVSGFGTVRQVSPIPPNPGTRTAIEQPVGLAGGRYLMWLNSNQASGADGKSLAIFDRRTRAVTYLGTIDARRLLADPLRPRVFFDGVSGEVVVLDAGPQGRRVLLPASVTTSVGEFAYAPGADVLAVAVATLTGPFPGTLTYELRLVNVGSATTLRTMPLPEAPTQLAISADARTAYVYLGGGSSLESIVAYDTVTGLETARSAPFPFSSYVPMMLDEHRGLLFLQHQSAGRLVALDPRTLGPVADLTVAPPGDLFGIVPGRGMTGAYIARRHGMACPDVTIDALDLTGHLRDSFAVKAVLPVSACPALYGPVFRAPTVVTDLSSTTAGHQVSLSWANPGDVSNFQLLVGTSPGITALALSTGITAGVVFDGVPSGVYFVRIVAHNEVGHGPASGEIRIVVP